MSGGENWVDVIVYNTSLETIAMDSTTVSNIVAYNYASGSNTVNISETQMNPSNRPRPIADMIDQVDEFAALMAPSPKPFWLASRAIFISWFGM